MTFQPKLTMVEREIGMPRDDEAYQQGGPEIGYRNSLIRKVTLDLSVARTTQKLDLAGNWLWAIDTVGLDSNVDVFFNEPIGQPVNFRRGQILQGYPFHRLYITNTAQASGTLTFHSSMQMFGIQNALTRASQVMERPPDLFSTAQVTIGAALTLIALANPLRRRILIKAHAANTEPVFVTNILGGLGSGYQLNPSQELEIRQLTLDIYGIRNAAAQVVSVLEENNIAV